MLDPAKGSLPLQELIKCLKNNGRFVYEIAPSSLEQDIVNLATNGRWLIFTEKPDAYLEEVKSGGYKTKLDLPFGAVFFEILLNIYQLQEIVNKFAEDYLAHKDSYEGHFIILLLDGITRDQLGKIMYGS